MWSVPPWSVSYISLKYMSYYSRPKNIQVKEKRVTQIQFFSLNITELFSSQVLFLLKVTHHFWGLLWTNAWDAACSPTLVGMATGSSIFLTMTTALLVYSHTYFAFLCSLLSFFLCHSHLLIMSSLCFFYLFFFTIWLSSILVVSHPLFFCPPFLIWSHCRAHSSLSACTCLCKQLSLPLCVLLHYQTKYIMLNSKKFKGDLHLKKVIKPNKIIQ